jgi:hypothetical protein
VTTRTSQEVYTTDAKGEAKGEAGLWEELLAGEGLSVLDGEGLGHEGAEVVYLGTSGADGFEFSGEADVEIGDEDEETDVPVGPTCPVLLREDFEVLEMLRERGYAATLKEAAASVESIVRLADAGLAHGRSWDGKVVLAMAGAIDGDVKRAANRAECDALEAGFLSSILEAEEIAREVGGRLGRLGGIASEKALVERFVSSHPREAIAAVLSELARRGEIRRVVGRASGIGLVALSGVPKEDLAAYAKRLIGLARHSAANRLLSHKAFLSEASGSRPTDDVATNPLAAQNAAEEFRAIARASEGKRLSRRARCWKRSSADEIDFFGKAARIRRWKERRRKMWAALSCRADPEKVAWETARALYLFRASAEGRVLLAVLGKGPLAQEELMGACAGGDEEVLERSVQALGEAKLIRRIRNRRTGEEFLAGTPEGRRAAGAALLSLMADSASGLPVPQDGPLAKMLGRSSARLEEQREDLQVELAEAC